MAASKLKSKSKGKSQNSKRKMAEEKAKRKITKANVGLVGAFIVI